MADEQLTNEQALALAGILKDPETAGRLTITQHKEIRVRLNAFKEQRAERLQASRDVGLSKAQAGVVQAAEDDPGVAETAGAVGPARIGIAQRRALGALREGVDQTIEGVVDLGAEIGVALNLFDREQVDGLKGRMAERRLKQKLGAIEEFGQVNSSGLELVGRVVPWVLATPAAAATFTRLALQNMMIGLAATGAVLSKDTLAERAGAMSIGAAAGVVFTLPALPSAARAAAARNFMRELNLSTSKQNAALESEIVKMLKTEDFGFSLAQITGGRFVFGLEQRTASTLQKGVQNKNIGLLFKNILKTARSMRKTGRSADVIALALRKTLTRANKVIHKRASLNFAAALDDIDTQFGDEIILSFAGGREYLRKLDDLIAEGADRLVPGGSVSAAFQKYRSSIDQLVNPVVPVKIRFARGNKGPARFDLRNRRTGEVDKVGFTLEKAEAEAALRNETVGGFEAIEITRITRGLNSLLRGKTAVLDSPDPGTNKAVAKALMGNLLAALETSGTNPQAIQALKGLRNNYKAEMMRLGKMEDLVIARTFGVKNMPADTDAKLDIVLANGKSGLKNVREFLEEWNPALLDDLRATVLRRAVRGSVDPKAPAVDTAIALGKLADNLSGPDGVGQLAKGLFTPAVQADLLRTARALRVIKNTYFTGISPTGGVSVDDTIINVVSRSPEFMARFITRVVAGGQGLERVMLDPTVRQAIKTIAEKGPTTKLGKIAMLILVEHIVGNDLREAQVAEAEEAAKRSQAIRFQGRPAGPQ